MFWLADEPTVLRFIEVPVDHYVRQLDELSLAQPRHVIERLIDHEQHPALRQIEAEVAQTRPSEQVEPIPEPVADRRFPSRVRCRACALTTMA